MFLDDDDDLDPGFHGASQSVQTAPTSIAQVSITVSAGHPYAGAAAGAALGFAAGPIGAIVGAVAGYFVGLKTHHTTWTGNVGTGSSWSVFGHKIIGTEPPT